VKRIPVTTLGCLAVTALLALAAPATHPASAGDPPPDGTRDLRLAAREATPKDERLAALARVIASGRVEDGPLALRAGASLLAVDPAAVAPLWRLARERGDLPPEALEAARVAVAAELAKAPPDRREALAVAGLYVGRREGAAEDMLAATLKAGPARDALVWDAPELAPLLPPPGPAPMEAGLPIVWAHHVWVADLLDLACLDDPKKAWPAMDALRAATKPELDAAPLLLATATPGATRTAAGLVPRRVRAIVLLGARREAAALPALLSSLDDQGNDGWVRVAAVTALGDLGDPRAIVPLCRVLFYLGDVHRVRDAWEYPGADNTDIPVDQWAEAPYQAIDSAVCDALLRLGVRGAAEWIVRERLRPSSGRWRIRVLQDGADAVRRSFPDAPRVYEPDAGLPQREAAYEALRTWLRTGPRLKSPVAEDDPRFAEGARALVHQMGEKSVMELQIVKRAAALIGAPLTPYVLEGLATSTKKVQRAELATTLGAVRDRRAIEPLLRLTKDPVSAVRANAIEALASYLGREDDPQLDGTSAVGTDAIVAALVGELADPEARARTSAVKALTAAPPRADVRTALQAHRADEHPENDFGDYRLAEAVATLVQTGEGLDAILAILSEPDLFRRRFVWELLWPALRLEPEAFDPAIDPTSPKASRPERAALERALAARRGGAR